MDEATVRAWLVSYIAEFCSLQESEIGPEMEFADFGLDSVDSIIIGGALEEKFDVEIDASIFLRNNNMNELIADLRQLQLIK
jgi:acyl carrier protein